MASSGVTTSSGNINTANPRVKVVGYAQAVQYGDGISYTNFSPDLVGFQLTSNGGTPLFTLGNFYITTNLDPKVDKNFVTNSFSNFITLSSLNLNLENTLTLLTNNAGVNLNLDKTNLSNYALFGSFTEFVRVSLEDIITNWPAALYVNPDYILPTSIYTQSGYTVENYYYDTVANISTFSVNVNVINNNFQINFLQNGSLANTFNANNLLRNLTINYLQYSIQYNSVEYDIIGFTGSTFLYNDYVYFSVSGNSFSGISRNDYPIYYVKPNQDNENLFYNNLPSFESYLLNRNVSPLFTSVFKYSTKSDSGDIIYFTDSVTWPILDGYNIDFNTEAYSNYVSKLLNVSTNFDDTTSNLMVRFLVTDSITEFDTSDVYLDNLDMDTSGGKVNKLLRIYGREYDDINNFITGIQFANTVSYDKNDNVPDIYLKQLASVMGWGLISSVLENDLLRSYIQPSISTYSGQSVGLTAVEADVELWRRIILNTPWLWKSKGTRKVVEFLFKFIGTPLGLITFNEYVYLAENSVDVNQFQEALILNGLSDDITTYPISLSGYPSPLLNTPDLYFQSNGLWYRETGGSGSTIDITTGNNPHVGPYDGGYQYINQFRELIPNFTAVTITSSTSTTSGENIFTNYNLGTVDDYSGNTYVDITTLDGVDFSNAYVVTTTIIEDPQHRQAQTDCGCQIIGELSSLSVCIEANTFGVDCSNNIAEMSIIQPYGMYEFSLYQYDINGNIYPNSITPQYTESNFINKICCNFSNSETFFYNLVSPNISTTTTQPNGNKLVSGFTEINSGYICCTTPNKCGCLVTCGWRLNPLQKKIEYPYGSGIYYLVFITETNEIRMTSPDGCNCVSNFTLGVPNITDQFTGEIGYGCRLTENGINEFDNYTYTIIEGTYNDRAAGTIGCTVENSH